MGLRIKVLGVAIAVVLAGFATAGVFAVERSGAYLVEAVETRAKAMLVAMAPPCAVSMANGEFETLDTYVGRLAEAPALEQLGLRALMVLNQEGRVVAHSDPTHFGDHPLDPFYASALASPTPTTRVIEEKSEDGRDEPLLEVTAPAESGPRWGTLVARFSLASVRAEMSMRRRWVVGSTIVLSVLVAGALVAFLMVSVLRRVRELSLVEERFGKGDLDARAPVRGRDELAMLARGFNKMAEQLREYTHGLEAKVEERAKSIVLANRKLEAVNSDLSRAVAQLERLAITDGLTGLYNHRHFQESLSQEVKRSERTGHPLSVVMIDVDHFKNYNDLNGHPAGDAVLQGLADAFKKSIRGVDVVARYGGEEFAVLLPDTELKGAQIVAEKIRRAAEERNFPNEERQPNGAITVSLGVATRPQHGATASDVLGAADRALYAAKAAGRNRVVTAPLADELPSRAPQSSGPPIKDGRAT